MKKEVLLTFSVLFSVISSCSKITTDSVTNTGIAYAYPVTSITIDGKITDWPQETVKYPIKNVFGEKLKNNRDFDAYFQVAYNLAEQSLYVVAVVTDDSHIIDTTENASWNSQDTYNLYLNSKNSLAGSGVVSYQFNSLWKNLWNPAFSWDPEVKNASWDDVETASATSDSTTIYECRIRLKDQIFIGKSMGIDHIIMDKDVEDESGKHSHITWGELQWKDYTTGKLGYVVLMDRDEPLGTISGQLKWKDKSVKGYPGKVRIVSTTSPTLWVQATVDSTGRYSAVLPQDTYSISPLGSIWNTGNDIKKIDIQESTVVIKAKANRTINTPDLKLSTLAAPDLIPEEGIMHDFDSEKAKLLDDFLRAYQDFYEIPGISLALIKDGQVIHNKTYGVKNTYTREPVDENTLFEAASVTKPVFAYAVCSLVEKGIIDLDTPLYKYLPFEDLAYDERYKLMTARHVLSHQTGLPNWANMNPDGKVDLKFTPGTGYGYSGEGFEYLKRVVASVTKKDIEVVLDEEILTPLGLKNTYFSKSDYLSSVVANGHFDNYPVWASIPDNPGMAWSMHTEAKAFTTFILALENRKGLKPETFDEMFKIQTIIPVDEDHKKQGVEEYFGLGISMEKTPYGLIYGHGGNNGDFQCQFRMFKDLNMGFVIFTNSNTGGNLAYDPITEFLITGKKKEM